MLLRVRTQHYADAVQQTIRRYLPIVVLNHQTTCEKTLNYFEALKRTPNIRVVDVGTGFLDASHSLDWVTGQQAIAITADSACAYDRFRKARKLDNYPAENRGVMLNRAQALVTAWQNECHALPHGERKQ